jgi:type IV pilus biogenesis protein CpaD/CtpE
VRTRAGSLTLTLGLLALAGCTTPVDRHWGEAYRRNVAAMVADPQAAQLEREPTTGLDPASTEQVVNKYLEKQGEAQEPTAMPSFIQIGTGAGSR